MSLLDLHTLDHCELCPRRCGANRAAGQRGACGVGSTLRLARAALHFWEEPPISGDHGSGTIFFSGCPLACTYCQNYEISSGGFGIDVPSGRLVEIMLELQEQGAHNINLVTATHWAYMLPRTISQARALGLQIPIVYNTSGYELPEAVLELGDVVDIWLTDYKYADAKLGARLSNISDYPERAAEALTQMTTEIHRRGGLRYTYDGLMEQGLLVRHLVLPGFIDNSLRALDAIWTHAGDVPIAVMNQYTPNAAMKAQGGILARAVSAEEYERVLDYADDLGFSTIFWQEGGTVDESFTPAFDTTGVLTSAP
ncbi:radical SAM protein [Collinsella sp. AGMB00827]|uniref:Radical SAM protein n=1 Tax=Collinsella ureilytica TaxID=2869515 RepID=A0ABS7MM04_9ACTN|nr:radical SAM protein [Collinsella urealyticum]MBY4798394.1 radical SAM protein [Collinsella urealyticum]